MSKEERLGDLMIEPHKAEEIASDFVKEKKGVDTVSIVVTEQKDGVWVVRGTCPIDLAGHPWRESFEVRVDKKGKITMSAFRLM
jgi:hypothetical protein